MPVSLTDRRLPATASQQRSLERRIVLLHPASPRLAGKDRECGRLPWLFGFAAA